MSSPERSKNLTKNSPYRWVVENVFSRSTGEPSAVASDPRHRLTPEEHRAAHRALVPNPFLTPSNGSPASAEEASDAIQQALTSNPFSTPPTRSPVHPSEQQVAPSFQFHNNTPQSPIQPSSSSSHPTPAPGHSTSPPRLRAGSSSSSFAIDRSGNDHHSDPSAAPTITPTPLSTDEQQILSLLRSLSPTPDDPVFRTTYNASTGILHVPPRAVIPLQRIQILLHPLSPLLRLALSRRLHGALGGMSDSGNSSHQRSDSGGSSGGSNSSTTRTQVRAEANADDDEARWELLFLLVTGGWRVVVIGRYEEGAPTPTGI